MLARYTYAIDSGRWDDLDEVFTPNAVIDYRSAGGIRGTLPEVRVLAGHRTVPLARAAAPGRRAVIGFEDGQAVVAAPFTDTLRAVAESWSDQSRGPGFQEAAGSTIGWCARSGWRSRELVEEQTWRTARSTARECAKPHGRTAPQNREGNLRITFA